MVFYNLGDGRGGGGFAFQLLYVFGVSLLVCTMDDSGVEQRQLDWTASKTILKWSEYHEIQQFFFLGLK